MARPNFLFVICDDHRASAIGAMGDPTVRTPVTDGLIARGTCLTGAHHLGSLCGAVCVPSRACLHTGVSLFRNSHATGLEDYHGAVHLREDLPILPEVLRAAGYRTFATGKWHNDRGSFHRGFAEAATVFFEGMSDHLAVPVYDYDPTGAYPRDAARIADGFSTEVFCDSAIDFLRRHTGPDPFFCYLAFTSPHDPRMAPEPYASLYPPEHIPLPANFQAEHPFDNGELTIRDEELAAFPRTEAEVRRHIGDYYAMISHHDAHLGRVLATLAETGRADDTIVVYTSDHGLSVGQHGLLGKQNLYEPSVRVPCVLAGPGLPAGRRIDALTYLYDLYPTVCELAGVPVPETVESRSLLPLVRGETQALREMVGCAYKDVQRMVSDGRWKLIRYGVGEAGHGTERVQLFDLSEDPAETRDLASDPAHRATLTRLASALGDWQAEVGDPWTRLAELPTEA